MDSQQIGKSYHIEEAVALSCLARRMLYKGKEGLPAEEECRYAQICAKLRQALKDWENEQATEELRLAARQAPAETPIG